MAEETSTRLLARWRAGDQEAATELFHRYSMRLVALVRGRLTAKVSPRLDAEDVVQSVYRSFFAASRAGRYELQRGGDLWQLLVTIALHKMQNQVRRNRRAKRSIDREHGFGTEDSFLSLGTAAAASYPAPEEAMALVEELELLLSRLKPIERRVVEMRLQGGKLEEIAAATQRSERTVCRILDGVKGYLREASPGRTQA
jgi:RNA polymerase sigma-70 factor, ECF subfamily